MSQSSVQVIPSPTATPFIAAMVGFDMARRVRYQRSDSRLESPSDAESWRSKFDISAPEQNARPAPVRTIAPTESSVSQASSCPRTSNPISGIMAFSLSGRLNVIIPTRPLCSAIIYSWLID